ncbi:hypothetical protein GLOTRDRAFT_138623 [Gloeophyllum trabeum ATCC 11539]|uniref:Uncharacterized protein n=1 Tax=Gloeophyllum trabeum (strain ATCC 11539 / FP-39264 / Madison 617) TaxID=670483 RepID=S7Q8W5_GLOTA|nr:uncharacterized protein GLOTRDRAFT_138623 [Gloeophyllum trabeum ATCC 11539]EPQ55868.1 hypothetical protein GLOTRDRAFT_138623 [Gloeophyllum trabeum ATCC 11539]
MATATAKTMLAPTVEESREKRLQKQQSRYRDRGGIFVPMTENPLIDILLSRKFLASPKKKSQKEQGASRRDKPSASNHAVASSSQVQPQASSSKIAPEELTNRRTSPRKKSGAESRDAHEQQGSSATNTSKQRTSTKGKFKATTKGEEDPTTSKSRKTTTTRAPSRPTASLDGCSDEDVPLVAKGKAKAAPRKQGTHKHVIESESEQEPPKKPKKATGGSKSSASTSTSAPKSQKGRGKVQADTDDEPTTSKPKPKADAKGKGKAKQLKEDVAEEPDPAPPKPAPKKRQPAKRKTSKADESQTDDKAKTTHRPRGRTKAAAAKTETERDDTEAEGSDAPTPKTGRSIKAKGTHADSKVGKKPSEDEQEEEESDAAPVPKRRKRPVTMILSDIEEGEEEDAAPPAVTAAKGTGSKATVGLTPLARARAKTKTGKGKSAAEEVSAVKRKKRPLTIMSDVEEGQAEEQVAAAPTSTREDAPRKKPRVEPKQTDGPTDIASTSMRKEKTKSGDAGVDFDKTTEVPRKAAASKSVSKDQDDAPPSKTVRSQSGAGRAGSRKGSTGTSAVPSAADASGDLTVEPAPSEDAKTKTSKRKVEDREAPVKKRARKHEVEEGQGQGEDERKRVNVVDSSRGRAALAPITVLSAATPSDAGKAGAKPGPGSVGRGEKENKTAKESGQARKRGGPKFPDAPRGPPQSVLDSLLRKPGVRLSSPVHAVDSDADPIDFLS